MTEQVAARGLNPFLNSRAEFQSAQTLGYQLEVVESYRFFVEDDACKLQCHSYWFEKSEIFSSREVERSMKVFHPPRNKTVRIKLTAPETGSLSAPDQMEG